jgi:hypothetical protein
MAPDKSVMLAVEGVLYLLKSIFNVFCICPNGEIVKHHKERGINQPERIL